MSLLNLVALGAALTAIVIGVLQLLEVTTLDGMDMLNALFVLAGTVWLADRLPAGVVAVRSK